MQTELSGLPLGSRIVPFGTIGKCSDCGLVMWKGERNHANCSGPPQKIEKTTSELLREYLKSHGKPKEKREIKTRNRGACDECCNHYIWPGRPTLKDATCPVCDSRLERVTKARLETHQFYECGTEQFRDKKCVSSPIEWLGVERRTIEQTETTKAEKGNSSAS